MAALIGLLIAARAYLGDVIEETGPVALDCQHKFQAR